MRILVAAVAGWLAGIAGAWLYLFYVHDGKPNMGGDFTAAVVAASVGTLIMPPVVYLPIIQAVRARGAIAWLYPLVCASVCPLPWLIVGGLWGGPMVIFTLISPEAVFVYSIFGPVGAVFGSVSWWLERRTT
jgi:hypothetical protein